MRKSIVEQYLEFKSGEYHDYVLFIRVGDFYEFFMEDAEFISKRLFLVVSKKGHYKGEIVKMCGIPHNSVDIYIEKLLDIGSKIAIIEQDINKITSEITRRITQIFTPGTTLHDNRKRCLMVIASMRNKIAISWIDAIDCQVKFMNTNNALDELYRIAPSEVLICENDNQSGENLKNHIHNAIITKRSCATFALQSCVNTIRDFYRIFDVECISDVHTEIVACGVAIQYFINVNPTVRLKFPKRYTHENYMMMNHTTRNCLELINSNSGNKHQCLVGIIGEASTCIGKRKIRNWIQEPSINIEELNVRYNCIDYMINYHNLRLSNLLSQIPDCECALSRIKSRNNSYKDVLKIQLALEIALLLSEMLNARNSPLLHIFQNLWLNNGIFDLLREAIDKESEWNISVDFNIKIFQLDEKSKVLNTKLQELEKQYKCQMCSQKLTIVKHNTLGYCIDIPKKDLKTQQCDFMRIQDLASSVRYKTQELTHIEHELIIIFDERKNIERDILNEICRRILLEEDKLRIIFDSIAYLDAVHCFARIAKERNYIRPQLTNAQEFHIIGGRHPVLELNGDFIENDVEISEKNVVLLTGPNMSGKSTFLRQNALIAIMAQVGSFVPAKYAKIGLIDKLFCRITSHDKLADGQSTFMVEMIETNNILRNATEKSLVILDEIGRGTSSRDGVALASAIVEYIHDIKSCRAMFATHYHEIIPMIGHMARIQLLKILIKKLHDKIVFLHKVIPGASLESYGIEMAELAGVPEEIIRKAREKIID